MNACVHALVVKAAGYVGVLKDVNACSYLVTLVAMQCSMVVAFYSFAQQL